MAQPTSGRARGFTLIEVIIALTIVALALAAATKAFNSSVVGAAHGRDRTLASWVALNKVTEMRLLAAWPDVGTSDGEVEFAGQDWRWEAAVSATDVERMRRLEVTAYPSDGSGRSARVAAFVVEGSAATGAEPVWEGLPDAAAPGDGEGEGDGNGGKEPPHGPGDPR